MRFLRVKSVPANKGLMNTARDKGAKMIHPLTAGTDYIRFFTFFISILHISF